MSVLNTILANAEFAMVRNETLEGKQYKAIPMVMLKEGVLNGSGGPTFYPAKEVSKAPAGWNMKPVVVYHPQVNGQGISATEKHVIENQKIGLIMNTQWKDGALKAEAWIDVEKANKVDSRVMSFINNNQMVEVSTGLFSDTEVRFGTHMDRKYGKVASNYVPDHIAILPDKKGALSIEDGAGLLRNAEIFNAKENNPQENTETTSEVTAAYASDVVTTDAEVPVVSVSSTENIVKSIENDATIIGSGQASSQPKTLKKKEYNMAKAQKVSEIVEKLALNSEEATALSELPESILEKTAAQLSVDAPQASAPSTLEEVLAISPEEIRTILNHGIESYNNSKAVLVEKLMQASDKVSADLFANHSIQQLEALASLIPAPAADSEGAPATTENQENAPAKFVGLSGVAGESVVAMNEDHADFDMVPKGIDFSK